MKGRVGWLSYVSLLVCIVILAGALIFGINRLNKAQESLDKSFSESLSWTAFQAEAELLRLHAAFEHALQEPDQDSRATLQLRLDIFWSRINLLREGEVGSRIAQATSDTSFIEVLVEDLERAATLLESHETLNSATMEGIEALSDAWEGPLHRLALEVFQWEQARDARLRQEVEEYYDRIVLSAGLVAFSVLILVLLLLRSLRRSRVLVEDVSQVRDQAKAAQDQLRLAIESINHGFAYYDAQDRLVICNQKYREIYQISAEAIQPDRTFEDILRYGLEHGQYKEAEGREEEWLAERLKRHYNPGDKIEQLLEDGRWILIEEHRTTEGGIVGIRVDVTELRNAREKAERLTETKSKFLAIMSHEIRTPLGGIIGMLDLLREEHLAPTARDQLDTAIASTEHLNAIVNDILDLSKLEADKLSFESEVFKVSDWIDSSLQLIEPKAARKGLTISTKLDPDIPAYLLGDVARLRQVLINLLDNAVKFSDEGVICLALELAEERETAVTLRCDISDPGIGISPEQQLRLFEDFIQLEEGFSRRHGGTGLGLSICRRIVENMGGRIGVESASGKGSTFWFEMLLATAEAPKLESAEEERPRPYLMEPVQKRGRRANLLLAEDNMVNQKLISTYLFRAGHHVDLASNGLEALEKASRQVYDMILMDVSMPEMDGLETASAIRHLPGAKGAVPIIAVTANALDGDVERCLAAGMNDYLSKPINREDLEDIVLLWLDRQNVNASDSGFHEMSVEQGSDGEPLVDEPVLADLFANLDRDTAAELIGAFLVDSQSRYDVLLAASDGLNRKQIKQEAHSIKGAAASFGAMRLSNLCGALEVSTETQTTQALSRKIQAIGIALDQTKVELERRLRDYSPV
jgi:signal transduction histidine kinase/CheY-like chemotaxis protein